MGRLRFSLFALVALGITLISCSTGGSPEEKLVRIAIWEDEGWTADGELTKLLFDGDAAVRKRAALALARVGDTLTLDSLAIALKTDRDPEVRAMAAFAIASDKWRRGGHHLIEALDREDNLATLIEILHACGRTYMREDYQKIMPFLHHPDARVRAQAALTFDMFNRHDMADSTALLLEDPDPVVRETALFALIRSGNNAVAEKALPFCDDASPRTRKHAYRLLGSATSDEARAQLLKGLEDSDYAVRAAAAEAFILRLDTIRILDMYPYLSTEEDPRVLRSMVKAITEHWRISARPHLEKLLKNSDPSVRASAIKALARRMDFDFYDYVTPGIDDPSPLVRTAYLEVFDEVGKFETLDTGRFLSSVRVLMSDPVPRVRARAVQSYITHAGGESETYLNRLFNDPDPYCQQLAINLIGSFQIRSYQDSLHMRYQQIIDQWRPELKWSILASTTNLAPSVHADSTRRDILDWGMNDPNRLVRWYTIAVWEKFREDHTGELGTYQTDLTMENIGTLLPSYSEPPTVRLQTTKGPMTVELRPDIAPRTVRRFLQMVRDHAYDDCQMNDIQPGNIVQTGDVRGDGWGLPEETVRDELYPKRIEPGTVIWLIHTRDAGHGVFAIALDPQPYLDWRYGIFGRVTEGLDVARELTYSDTLRTIEIVSPAL